MQTSINLQEPFTYSIIPILLIIIILLLLTLCIYIKIRKNKKNTIEKLNVKEIPQKVKKNIPLIKKKHLNQIFLIEKDYKDGKIALREAYQLISENIRLFVFEVTDITTQNYSLIEIKKINIPDLYELIKEYYEPEFASKSVGDFENSINKARRVINEWN